MPADHPDPAERWREVADWYVELARSPGWAFVAPMVGLAAWLGARPFAPALFPQRSHDFLGIRLRPEYQPNEPCLYLKIGPEGQPHRELCGPQGRSRQRWVSPIESAHAVIASGLLWLDLVTRPRTTP